MNPLIFYSLVLLGKNKEHRVKQLILSVQSLRRANPSTDVLIILYGSRLNSEDSQVLRRFNVRTQYVGSYEKNMRPYCPPAWAEAFGHFPLFQKWISWKYVLASDFKQALYLDSDTYIFRDFDELFRSCRSPGVYAREEPSSRRSYYGYDPSYVDEDALKKICKAEKIKFTPPFNTGVVLMDRKTAQEFAKNLKAFFDYAMRMTGWLIAHPCPEEQGFITRARRRVRSLERIRKPHLPFPSSNQWLAEEIASWLALGASGAKIRSFSMTQILQGPEYQNFDPLRHQWPFLIHYYNLNSSNFAEEWLRTHEKTIRNPGARI